MKNVLIFVIFLAGGTALYQQNLGSPNILLQCAALVALMFCVYRLGSKLPSKNQDDYEQKL